MNPAPLAPRGHALRLGRHSQPGQVYLVTTVTLGREPVFAEFAHARALVSALRQEAWLGRAETLSYVVMPDHLHWLLALGTGAALSNVMRDVKAVSARRIGRAVWQKGFHDRAVRSEESLVDVARYVIQNPVRAGLVRRVGAYPHWDAVWVP